MIKKWKQKNKNEIHHLFWSRLGATIVAARVATLAIAFVAVQLRFPLRVCNCDKT